MLEAIRKYAHNPVFKIIFALLILAFAISGITGMNLLSGQKDYVAKVGNEKITAEDIEIRYNQLLRSMGPQVLQLKESQLEAFGVSRQQVLKTLIQGALVRQEAKAIGIVVGEESVKTQIKKMPIFADESGKFDPERFRLFLEKMNMTELQLQRDMQNDIRNLILASTVMNNTPKNIFVAEEIAKAIKVTRDIEVIKVPASHVQIAATPSDEELKQFYFENSAKYQLPETRDVSYVSIPKPAADDKAGYDKITKLEDEIAGGSNIDEIAAKMNLQVQKMNNIPKNAAKINELAFKAKKDQLSPVTLNEEGNYVIVQVNEIHASTVPELATVKDKVIADWKVKKQSDENIRFAQSLVAELKEGKPTSEVAAKNGLAIEKLANFSAENKQYGDEFIVAVFNAGKGKVTNSIPSMDGGYIVAKVVDVKENPVTAQEINQAITQGAEIFQQEIFSQYMQYLEKKYPIVLNSQELEKNTVKPKDANPA